MADLLVAPCSYEAAKHAVLHWHYSQTMPTGKLVKFGVWEAGTFIGTVLYGRGANNRAMEAFGLDAVEGCELVRVALRDHVTPVSQIVAVALSALRRQSPGLRLVVSYADPDQGHHGGIYQAGNWLYLARSQAQRGLVIGGREVHKRTADSLYGTASPERLRAITGKAVEWGPMRWKHVYVYPLDKGMRRRLSRLAQPYPQRADEGSMVSRPGTSG